MDFTLLEAIRSATQFGGELFGEAIGLVKEGYLADLILVDGDPSKDIKIPKDADRLLAIMKDGSFHKAPPSTMESGRVAVE